MWRLNCGRVGRERARPFESRKQGKGKAAFFVSIVEEIEAQSTEGVTHIFFFAFRVKKKLLGGLRRWLASFPGHVACHREKGAKERTD